MSAITKNGVTIDDTFAEAFGMSKEDLIHAMYYEKGIKLGIHYIPLHYSTAFQKRVWAAMSEIPYGETATYGGLATMLDSGPRAVGMACGRNPIPIVVPCHRVLASGGREGGFSGGRGLPTKRQLLAIEGTVLL